MKARIVYVSPEVNLEKIQKLEDLHIVYKKYVQSCIDQMISDKRIFILPSEQNKGYFSKSDKLSVHLRRGAYRQTNNIIESWLKGLYLNKLRKYIKEFKDLTDCQRMELRCIGKYYLKVAGLFGKGTISQEMINLYWSWVWDPEITGNRPKISENFPIQLNNFTCVFKQSEKSNYFKWWIRCSTLENRHRIEIPLSFNPYIKDNKQLATSVLLRKINGRWAFIFCDKSPEEKFDGSKGKIGVDIGLNTIAATSNGCLYGSDFKPKFDKLYKKVMTLRSNRYRQELKKDSKRLARLENKLSGMIKTATGTVANKLVKSFPNHTFVLENLDLRGCRGQKRFAYRKLFYSLSSKACIEVVNPAYTSQMCPSCGYADRKNRSGTSFHCVSCGRKSHADVVGGVNLLGRSGDKQINSCEDHTEVRSILRERYRTKRSSSLDCLTVKEPKPNGLKLTVKGFLRKKNIRTASNQVTLTGVS